VDLPFRFLLHDIIGQGGVLLSPGSLKSDPSCPLVDLSRLFLFSVGALPFRAIGSSVGSLIKGGTSSLGVVCALDVPFFSPFYRTRYAFSLSSMFG